MNMQPTRTLIISSWRREVQGKDPLLLFSELGPEEPAWVDLPGADRAVLEEMQQALGFSPEVITYGLLRYRVAKVIHTDSGLFLVTFLTLPHSSSLFTLWELKMCVSSRFLLTVHRFSSPVPLSLESRLPGLRGAIDFGTGHLLRVILERTVQSYETVVAEIEKRLPRGAKRDPGQTPEEQARSRRMSRGEKFALFLRNQRVFLQNVEREGRKLFHPNDRTRLKWLEERVGVLARIAWEAARTPGKGEEKTPDQEV
jgi:Mg2+ and Co2+ transporter CorA